MDIGDGTGVVFKIESQPPFRHRPFRRAPLPAWAASTAIFTMGARPIASLNSLRFGKLTEAKTQHPLAGGARHRPLRQLFRRTKPLAARSISRMLSYQPLVNAMSVGIIKNGETVSFAEGTGNPVFFVEAFTGKMASGAPVRLGRYHRRQRRRPSGRSGWIRKKKLLEACLK